MDEEREKLLQKLRDANPVEEEQFDNWVAQEGGRFLETRVFARERPSVDRHSWQRSMAIPLVATIVLAVGIATIVFTLAKDGSQTTTSTGSQWAGSESTAEHVLRQEALERLVALSNSLDSSQSSATSPIFADMNNRIDTQLVGRAIAADILLPCEGPDFRLKEPVTRGEFALWVWRAWGSRLAPTRTANFVDLAKQPEAEQDAIIGLAQAGLIQDSDDGLFHPNSPLTSQDESLILTRLAEVIEP